MGVKLLNVVAGKAPLDFLCEYVKALDKSSEHVAVILPSQRNGYYLAKKNFQYIDIYTIKDFYNYLLDFSNKLILPKEVRPFFLRKAVAKISAENRHSIFHSTDEKAIVENFLAFADNTKLFFSFFQEYFGERIEAQSLKERAKYSDYEHPVDALLSLWEAYKNEVHKEGFADEIEMLLDAEFNEIFEARYDKYFFLISGFLQRRELEILKKLGEKSEVTLIFNYVLKKHKHHDFYEDFFGCKDSLEDKPIDFSKKKIEFYACDNITSQVDMITKMAFDLKNSHNIPFEEMAVIHTVTDDAFDFVSLDTLNLFDNAASLKAKYSQIYSILKKLLEIKSAVSLKNGKNSFLKKDILALISFPLLIKNDNSFKQDKKVLEDSNFFISEEEVFKLSFFKLNAVIAFLSAPSGMSAGNVASIIKALIKEVGEEFSLKAQDKEGFYIEALYQEICRLENIYLEILKDEENNFINIATLIINALGEVSKHIGSGKISLMADLESRNMSFKAIFIPNMNIDKFPQSQPKDLFLSTDIKQDLKLPTRHDREALQKNYLLQAIANADFVLISYISNSVSRNMSVFVNEVQALSGISKVNKYHISKAKSILANLTSGKYESLNTASALTVPKTDEIIKKLEKYAISATAFDDYLYCPLKFYLSRIERIKKPEEEKQEADSQKVGTAFHEGLSKVFDNGKGLRITDNAEEYKERFKECYIKSLEAQGLDLDNSLIKYEALRPLERLEEILSNLREAYINEGYLESAKECHVKKEVELPSGKSVKLNGYIDNIDVKKDGSAIRIIDYKYKKLDKIKFLDIIEEYEDFNLGVEGLKKKIGKKGIEQVSDKNAPSFQLYFYAYLYYLEFGKKPDILTYFSIKEASYSKLIDYTPNTHSFFEKFLKEKLTELYDKTIPFTMACNNKVCEFCDYMQACKTYDIGKESASMEDAGE